MKWQQLIIENYVRVAQVLEKALEGLTLDDLNLQSRPDCNSIGWLTWHLTRAQDRAISDLMREEHLWVKDKWHAKFLQDRGAAWSPHPNLRKSPNSCRG